MVYNCFLSTGAHSEATQTEATQTLVNPHKFGEPAIKIQPGTHFMRKVHWI